MKTLFFFISILVLISCESKNETKIKGFFVKLESKYNCVIEYEQTKNNVLNIKIKNKSEILFLGKILIELHKNPDFINVNNFKISLYGVQQNSLSLTKKELDLVLLRFKKYNFLKEQIINRNYKGFYNNFNSQIRSQFKLSELSSNFDKLIQKEYSTFEGFTISKYKSKTYIIFKTCNTLKNHHLMISLLFNSNDYQIHAFELE
jgi:hypothetical protein